MGHMSFPHIHSNEDSGRRKSHLDPNFQLVSPLLVALTADKCKQKQAPGTRFQAYIWIKFKFYWLENLEEVNLNMEDFCKKLPKIVSAIFYWRLLFLFTIKRINSALSRNIDALKIFWCLTNLKEELIL